MNGASSQRSRTREPGASRSHLAAPVHGWLASHARCLLESLGRLHRRWLASVLTTLVIGIALALPTGLYIMVKNLDTLAGNWHRSVQISVYLDQGVTADDGAALAKRLANRDDIAATHFISAEQGLAEFKKQSGFGGALDALGSNPLPGVIEVTPRPDLPEAAVDQLLDTLGTANGVARAELDQAWLRRLTAILALFERAAWVIGILLAAAVLFIVGNTVRLDIENRREEIEVMKLLGATNAFIRRPFLYSGFWYGLFGALLALAVLGGCYLALGGPLAALTQSYDGSIQVHGLGFLEGLELIGVGVLLGWGGCVLTVNRRLAAIEPL